MGIGANDPNIGDAQGADVGAIEVRRIRRNAASRVIRVALAARGRRPGRRPTLARRYSPERIEHCPGTCPPEAALRSLGAASGPHEPTGVPASVASIEVRRGRTPPRELEVHVHAVALDVPEEPAVAVDPVERRI